MSVAAGASDINTVIRGKKLQSLLRDSKLFSHILSDLSEEDITRIIEHGPKDTDRAIVSRHTLNAIDDDPMRREFIMAYLTDKKLGTLYPDGTILQGYKQSKLPTANAADYWHYLMVNDPARRAEAMKKMFDIIPARPRKTRLAPRAPKNSWNSSSNNSSSSKKTYKLPMPINNIEFAAKFLSANQLKKVQAMKEQYRNTHTRKHKSKGKKRNTRSHSR